MADEFKRVDSEFDMLRLDKILKDIIFCRWCNARIEIIEYHDNNNKNRNKK